MQVVQAHGLLRAQDIAQQPPALRRVRDRPAFLFGEALGDKLLQAAMRAGDAQRRIARIHQIFGGDRDRLQHPRQGKLAGDRQRRFMNRVQLLSGQVKVLLDNHR